MRNVHIEAYINSNKMGTLESWEGESVRLRGLAIWDQRLVRIVNFLSTGFEAEMLILKFTIEINIILDKSKYEAEISKPKYTMTY